MKLNLSTILAILGAAAELVPDLTGLAAYLTSLHVGWLTHVAHALGIAALLLASLPQIIARLRPVLALAGLATPPGALAPWVPGKPGDPQLPKSPPTESSEAETPIQGVRIVGPRKPDAGSMETRFIIAISIIGAVLCLAMMARAETPTSPQLGGCLANNAVCFGTAADVVLTKVGLSSSNKGISGGFSTGVGYGVTVAPDKFYATGLDLFLNVNLSGSSALASRVSPALMVHAMNYLFLGVTLDVTAPTDTSSSYGTGWSLLLGFGSTITSITPGYAKQEAARQVMAAKAVQTDKAAQ